MKKALKIVEAAPDKLSDKAVHRARKRVGQARAALRTCRGNMDKKQYRRENRSLRDIGRALSELRDAKVLIDTLDGLPMPTAFNRETLMPLRTKLMARYKSTRSRFFRERGGPSALGKKLRSARKRVDRLGIEGNGWKVLKKGIQT